MRVSFARNSAGAPEITGTNNYYPFGLNHIGGGKSPFSNYHSYKFGGKELQETGMYDFGARMYMPDLGRWGAIDPMAEAIRRYSPYNYAFNNPISFIDPDGMAPRQFAMISDARPDTTSGWTNPGWLGRGAEINYGAVLESYGGGGVYETEEGTEFKGDAIADALKVLAALTTPKTYDFSKFDFTNVEINKPNDIVFLTDSKAVGGLGHAAALIGNEKDGWYYYSLNGTGGERGRAYGDAIGANVGTSLGKISLDEAIKKANIINPNYVHNYDKNIRLISTSTEDKAMMVEAAKTASVEKYILTAQDCLTVPMSAFNKLLHMRGGLGPQTAKVPNSWSFFLPASIWSYNLYLPSDQKLKYKK